MDESHKEMDKPPSGDNQSVQTTPVSSCQHGDIHNNECPNVVQWSLYWAGRGCAWSAALPAVRSSRSN